MTLLCLQFYLWKQEENTTTQMTHLVMVVDHSNVFNGQKFLLLLLFGQQPRYKLAEICHLLKNLLACLQKRLSLSAVSNFLLHRQFANFFHVSLSDLWRYDLPKILTQSFPTCESRKPLKTEFSSYNICIVTENCHLWIVRDQANICKCKLWNVLENSSLHHHYLSYSLLQLGPRVTQSVQ